MREAVEIPDRGDDRQRHRGIDTGDRHQPLPFFALGSDSGARISELCGLSWADVTLDDLDEAEITFEFQVDRHGKRRPTKTDGSARTVPIPPQLALVLARHMRSAHDPRSEAFVFATRTGSPLGQRNVARELRKAQQRATDKHGEPTLSVLHQTDATGNPIPAPAGSVPSMHSFGTQSPLGRCSRARAWTRSLSSSAIEMRPSRVSSTSARSPTPASAHAPLQDGGRVWRLPPNRARRRRVDIAKPSDAAPPLRPGAGSAARFRKAFELLPSPNPGKPDGYD
ncbi:MAG: tyrosine-type recombinase/integrase [Solirubrobacteraceae bacterium]